MSFNLIYLFSNGGFLIPIFIVTVWLLSPSLNNILFITNKGIESKPRYSTIWLSDKLGNFKNIKGSLRFVQLSSAQNWYSILRSFLEKVKDCSTYCEKLPYKLMLSIRSTTLESGMGGGSLVVGGVSLVQFKAKVKRQQAKIAF